MYIIRTIIMAMVLWVTMASFSRADSYDGVTTPKKLNVRESPRGAIVDCLDRGTAVVFREADNGNWVKVRYWSTDGDMAKEGWVVFEYVDFEALRPKRGDCENEFRSNVEVCADVVDVDLSYEEDYDTGFYESCSISAKVNISSDYQGGTSLVGSVVCNIVIEYIEQNDTRWSVKEFEDTVRFSLEKNDTDQETLEFKFRFKYNDKVVGVAIKESSCKIERIELR